MPGLNDLNIALRMRDTIERMVRAEMNAYRPIEKYGRVISVNRFSRQASVLLNGDFEAIKVKMATYLQPFENDEQHGLGKGCMVLVGGTPNNYWIKDIVSGRAFSVNPVIDELRLYGGSLLHIDQALHKVIDASGTPALGNTWHMGRFDNTDSFGGDATGFIELTLRQEFFSSLVKHYTIPVFSNATNGNWRKIAPVADAGPYAGHDCELEVMVDGTGIELRVRRTKDNAGFTPGGYIIEAWAHMAAVTYIPSVINEESSVAPTRFYGTDSIAEGKGPFFSPGEYFATRAQMNLQGGGGAQMNLTTGFFSWTERFLIHGQGVSQYIPGGYYEITQPPNGTVIPLYGSLSGYAVTVTASGIPLGTSQTLYYEVPWGDPVQACIPANFRIVAHDDTSQVFQVPSHWIMVATRAVSLDQAGDCKLGSGIVLNGPGWQNFTLTMIGATSGGTLGNSTVQAKYLRTGRTYDVRVVITVGTTFSGGAGPLLFSLPQPAAADTPAQVVGAGLLINDSPAQRIPTVISLNSVTRWQINEPSQYISVTGTAPISVVAGDSIRAGFRYEAAYG